MHLLRSKFFVAKAVALLPLEVRYFFRGQILTEEYYRQPFYNVDHLKVIDAEVWGRPIGVMPLDDGNLQLTYTIGVTPYTVPVTVGKEFSTPHFNGRIVTDAGRKWPAGIERGTLYFTINDPMSLTSVFASRINVTINDPSAKTINIGYSDHNALLARDICQAMADAYITYDLERKSESAENILRFIESQKDTVFEELRASELKLEFFKRDNRVADMDQLTPLLLQRSDEYEDEMLKLRMEDNLLKEIEHAAKQDEGHLNVYELTPMPIGTDFASSLEAAITRLGKMLEERATMAFEVTLENASLMALDRQIAMQQGLIMKVSRPCVPVLPHAWMTIPRN
jgi:hypothetical protein